MNKPAFFIVMILSAGLIGCQEEDPVAKIKAGCEREFGAPGMNVPADAAQAVEMRVNDCRLRLMTRYLLENQQKKLDAAYK